MTSPVMSVDLSRTKLATYSSMVEWCANYLDPKTYKWHHQPSRGKYWIDFLTATSASMFVFQWNP